MQSLKVFRDETFPLGYNDKYSPINVPDGYCITAQNLYLSNRNIAQRTGYSVAGTDTNTLLVSKSVLGAARFKSGATTQIIKAYDNAGGTDTHLAYWTGSGDWTKITNEFTAQENPVEMEMAAAAMYITNGVNAVIKWTGSASSTPAGFPITKYLAFYHNYMFAANNATYKSRIYFSNLGAPETWGGSDYIDIVPDDGYEITGLARFKDDLVIGKQNRVHIFNGWGDTTFTIKSTADKSGYGCVAGRTMMDVGQYFFYMTIIGDIPHIVALAQTQYDTIMPVGIVSNDIEGTMKTINKDYIANSCGYFDGKKAYFFVPTGSNTYNDTCLVVDLTISGFGSNNVWVGGWTKHTGMRASTMFASDITGENLIYFAEDLATKKSKLYVLDTSNTDDGTAIEYDYESRHFMPSEVNPTKWKYLWVYGDAVGNVDVSVWGKGDLFGYDSIGTINLSSKGTTFPFIFPAIFGDQGLVRKRFDLNVPRKRSFQIRFTRSNSGAPVVINNYELRGYVRPVAQT